MGDSDGALRGGIPRRLQRRRECFRARVSGQLEHAAKSSGRGDRHDARDDRDRDAARPGAGDEGEVLVGVEEELSDRRGGTGGLLGQERIDVLEAVTRARVAVGERRDGDLDRLAGGDLDGSGHPGDLRLAIRRALRLHAVDQLHELGGGLEVAERHIVLSAPRRRVAAQREEAGDAGVEELADHGGRLRVAAADAGEVGDRRNGGLAEDVREDGQRAVGGRTAGTEGHRDEARARGSEHADGLVESRQTVRRARRIDLEGERDTAGRGGRGGARARFVRHHGSVRSRVRVVQPVGRGAHAGAFLAGGCRARLSLLPGRCRAARSCGRRWDHCRARAAAAGPV